MSCEESHCTRFVSFLSVMFYVFLCSSFQLDITGQVELLVCLVNESQLVVFAEPHSKRNRKFAISKLLLHPQSNGEMGGFA